MAQINAAIVGVNISYLFLAFLPPILWLLFYLREDKHPEPKLLLLLTFFGGMASALLALVIEFLLFRKEGLGLMSGGLESNALLFFLVIGFIEEYVKYLPVKFLIIRRLEFDEPIDAMIYMMTSALGFAALENALFIFPIIQHSFFSGIEVTANRFLGANLLHALSSGIVGFFLARAWFVSAQHKRRYLIAFGLVFASVLHAVFNYLILIREVIPQGTFYIILLLSIMAVIIFVDFERLKMAGRKSGPESPNKT